MTKIDSFTVYSLPFISLIIVIVMGVVAVLSFYSYPILEKEGLRFITSIEWNTKDESYGILPALAGTFYTSFLAVIFSIILSLGVVVFVYEYAPRSFRGGIQSSLYYAAAIPTVVYGIWGLDYVVPLVRNVSNLLSLKSSPTGQSILAAAIVLVFMNTPYLSLIISEAYRSIPFSYEEALYSIGALGFERFKVKYGLVKGAVVSATLLALGRCVGETTAVSMLIGNSYNVAFSPLEPGVTVSSIIVNFITEASLYRYMTSALYGAALIMLLFSVSFTALGVWIARKLMRGVWND